MTVPSISVPAAFGIGSAVESCLECYRTLNDECMRSKLSQDLSTRLKDQHERLVIWAKNVKARLTGPASLDYRLRDASPIRTRIVDLLDEYRMLVGDACSIICGRTIPGKWLPDDLPDDDGIPGTELEQIFMDIAEVVDNLLALSITVQTPAQHDFLVTPRTENPFPARDDSELYARQLVQNHFPLAGPCISERLGTAIWNRRRYFEYRAASTTVPSDFPRRTAIGESFELLKPLSFPSDMEMTRRRIPDLPRQSDGVPFDCPYCNSAIELELQQDWEYAVPCYKYGWRSMLI